MQVNPANPAYNGCRIIKLRGPVDFGAFLGALQTFVDRHDVWRASFVETERGSVQRIADRVRVTCPLEDLAELGTREREQRLEQWISQTAWEPFDFSKPPLARWRAFRFRSDEYRVVMTLHHIITDGGSFKLMMEELAADYQARGNGGGRPLAPQLQYQDFSQWHDERIERGALAESEAYWLRRLGGELPVLELPIDRPRPGVPSYRGTQHRRSLSPALSGGLKDLRRRQDTTVFRLMLAAFEVLLARVTGQTDIIVGVPVSGRVHPALERVQGNFANMVAMRTELSGDPSFREALERVKESCRQALEHREYPFDTLVRRLNPRRDPSRPPIFNTMLVMREPTFTEELRAGDVLLTQDEAPLTRISRYELTVLVAKIGEQLRLTVEYSTDLFDATTAARLAEGMEHLLEAVAADPDLPISRLPVLSEAGYHAVSWEWNDSCRAREEGARLHELFEKQASRSPEAVAVAFGGCQVSYRELTGRARQLGRYLRRLGVGPEVRVAVCLERSVELVVGLLGILEAGAAYVPLDPSYPRDRLAFMIEDCRAPVVLACRRTADILPDHGVRRVWLDRDASAIGRERRARPRVDLQADGAAYVIYTSGSTGRPKGAINTHRAICNRLLWMQEAYGLTADDRVLQKTPFGFDVSVWELFWPLLVGARLVVAPPGAHRDSAAIVRLIAEEAVTTLHFVPSMLQAFLDARGLEHCRSLKRVVCSGEALTRELESRFFARLDAELHNLYGPTEAAIDVTSWACERQSLRRSVPIGRPIANTQIMLLDASAFPTWIGATGHLHIGGVGLARGYLGRPALTAEMFVPNPAGDEPGARLYRSGDLARQLGDGTIEYLGRVDHQLKIRGFRIELGEIESVLCGHPGVREAAVLPRQDSPGEPRLVAYVVPAAQPPVTTSELRGLLRAQLPEYMVPATFVTLVDMPLTPNGKLDRKALPDAGRDPRAFGSRYVAPRDALEWEVTRLWEETLAMRGLGVHDNFFDVGGHSLVAISLVKKIQQHLGVDLPVTVLTETSTIAEVSAYVRNRRGGELLASGLVPIREGETEAPPLFLIHAFRGGVFTYHALAGALGGRYPIYGLQATGLADGEEPLESIPEIATRYVELIRRRQPTGPYRLLGWSFGGTVAYEMTRQLESAGEEVSLLAFLDTSTPEGLPAEISSLRGIPRIAQALFDLDPAPFEGLDEPEGLDLLLARCHESALLPATMTVDMLGRLVKVVVANAKAISRYRLAAPVRADVHLLVAETDTHVRDPESWRPWTEGTLRVLSVSGSHHDMIHPPAVTEVAAALRRVLDAEPEARTPVRRSRPPATVPEMLAQAVASGPRDPFLLWGEGPWTTFAEFDAEARRFAGGLRNRGVVKGDRVAVFMDNRAELLTATYGTLLAGAVLVPINSHLTSSEAAHVTSHCGARFLVGEPRHLPRFAEVPAWPELELVISAPARPAEAPGPASVAGRQVLGWAQFLADTVDPSAVEVRADDLAFIQYTSGTTALPKGAMLTHGALVAGSFARGRHVGYRKTDTMLVVSPLFHLNAQVAVMMGLLSHFRIVLQEKFSASRFWSDVQRFGITTLNGMQTIPRILLARAPVPEERANPLETVVGILSPELHRRFEERFGVTMVPVYALTEDLMSVLGPREGLQGRWRDKIGTAGRPIEPAVHEIRIVDDEGRPLPAGQRGEIVKRSPAQMLGYYKDPAATAAALRDGWVYTGDLGYLDDDGFLYFVGRKKDAIRRSGEMISAAEVEAAMVSHPAVAEVAVIGVPDPIRSEEVKAFVVLAEGRSRSDAPPEKLLEHCAERLAPFKMPRYIEYRSDLPRTATLKIRKDLLRTTAGAPAGEVFDRENPASLASRSGG